MDIVFPYLEKRVLPVTPELIAHLLEKHWITLEELLSGLACKEDAKDVSKGCTVLCSKGVKCVVWIGKKGVSSQMTRIDIGNEKSKLKDLE